MIPFTVWIVEDDVGYRRNLRLSLQREPHITCSRVFPSCVEFLQAIKAEDKPDLILMDLGLPEMSGIDGIRELKAIAPDVAVVVLTVFEDKQKVLKALEVGASGYMLKSASVKEIVTGLGQVFYGGASLSPEVARIVLEEMQRPNTADYTLSDREIEVLQQLAEGLALKEISQHLHISRATVAFHLGNIYRKMEVQSQTGAVAKAMRAGLI